MAGYCFSVLQTRGRETGRGSLILSLMMNMVYCIITRESEQTYKINVSGYFFAPEADDYIRIFFRGLFS